MPLLLAFVQKSKVRPLAFCQREKPGYEKNLPTVLVRIPRVDWIYGAARFGTPGRCARRQPQDDPLPDVPRPRREKTATCGLVEEYERDQYPLPKVGDQKILVDGEKCPACIVEVTEANIVPFSQIDKSFAYDEGEGDRSYEFWRKEHLACFTKSMNALGKPFHEQLPTVCERFKLLYL